MQMFGNDIEVKLFKPIDNEKILYGALVRFDKDTITLEIQTEEKKIERKQIAQIKLRYNW